jgi:hypothetical protein
MRTFVHLLSAILVIPAVFIAPIHAQFRQPTKEELQMTSDPKAPGAEAVIASRNVSPLR